MQPKFAEAVDLSHHLSELSRRREPSQLKKLQKFPILPGSILLAGGLPDPSYFPFSSIGGEAMIPESFSLTPPKTESQASTLSWLWKSLFGSGREQTETMKIPRFGSQAGDIDLATALQYGPAVGMPQLSEFIHDFTAKVYRPAYANWTTLIDVGNTDGWFKAMATLCEPGEGIITDEWTYPSALSVALPHQVLPVPVAMDSQGMRADALEDMLANWDTEARGGKKRPHVMYIVPVGQNPCGLTMGIERKKEIYEICVKYDVVIVEDDPYYFLQEGPYTPKSARTTSDKEEDTNKFIQSLVPSFLRVDYQGRVIRLDTFSKTLAPGARLGWFTCNPLFAERLERQAESTTQRPCGFAQALIGQLLSKQWGLDNYVRWLQGLRAQYTMRRNFMVDCIMENFTISQTYSDGQSFLAGLPVYVARPKPRRASLGSLFREKQAAAPLMSFVAPSSGMFVWIQMHFENLPPMPPPEPNSDPDLPATREEELWLKLGKAGLLIGPGVWFAAERQLIDKREGHFRMSFSSGEFEKIKKGMDILGDVVHEYFGV